ncbi:MAG: reverse transcriptase-like protein [Thermoplasmata archaeon]
MELYIDASSLPTERGPPTTLCVLLLKDRDTQVLTEEAPPSRNELEAKYFALEKGLKTLASRGTKVSHIRVYTDCWMLVNQLEGKYEVKDPGFRHHKRLVEDLMAKLGSVEIRYIPKNENLAHVADKDIS